MHLSVSSGVGSAAERRKRRHHLASSGVDPLAVGVVCVVPSRCPSGRPSTNATAQRRKYIERGKGLMMWYVLGGMIVASVGYGLYRILSGKKDEEFGKPQSFLWR